MYYCGPEIDELRHFQLDEMERDKTTTIQLLENHHHPVSSQKGNAIPPT